MNKNREISFGSLRSYEQKQKIITAKYLAITTMHTMDHSRLAVTFNFMKKNVMFLNVRHFFIVLLFKGRSAGLGESVKRTTETKKPNQDEVL